ncbi:MAG TPA: cysteine-rich CWC family protein [Casimicrobiaceae bacterium]|nr:cysteine-rich CWC family protein [Casimicrobiaceae bacterium]
MTRSPIDPSRCPRCGGPNGCAMATASTSGAARAEPCWCTRVTVPASLLDDLPADAKGVACLCAACIAGSATGNADTSPLLPASRGEG